MATIPTAIPVPAVPATPAAPAHEFTQAELGQHLNGISTEATTVNEMFGGLERLLNPDEYSFLLQHLGTASEKMRRELEHFHRVVKAAHYASFEAKRKREQEAHHVGIKAIIASA